MRTRTRSGIFAVMLVVAALLVARAGSSSVQRVHNIKKEEFQTSNYTTPAASTQEQRTIKDEPNVPLSSKTTARPVKEVQTTQEQEIPAMEVQEQVVDQVQLGEDGPVESQTKVVTKKRPANYHPLLSAQTQDLSGASSKPLSFPAPPPIQQLESCDFDPVFKDLLGMINKLRVSTIGQLLTPQVANVSQLCMNAKLMMSAKLQSDFQALAKVPTHAGPRSSQLGGVHDRLVWAGFGQSPDLDKGTEESSFDAEEVIFYWPNGPADMQLQYDFMITRLKEALRAWKRDDSALAILTNPEYRFFGSGITRSQTGPMYLTVIVAKAAREVCNTCPEDAVDPGDAGIDEADTDMLA